VAITKQGVLLYAPFALVATVAAIQITADNALPASGGNLTGNVTADAGITIDGVDVGTAVLDADFAANGLCERTAEGVYTTRAAVTTSAGAGDSGKAVVLNASGKVDSTMLPSMSIWEDTGTAVLINNTGAPTDVDTVNLAWDVGAVSHVYLEVVLEYPDRSRVVHRIVRFALTDNPASVGAINSSMDTATGSDVNVTLTVVIVGTTAYLRYTAGDVGVNRNMWWAVRTKAAQS